MTKKKLKQPAASTKKKLKQPAASVKKENPNRKSEETGATTAMFSGMLTFMAAPMLNIQELALEERSVNKSSIVALGIPFDSATSNRPGTRFGPRAIRMASKMLSWQKVYPWEDDLYNSEGNLPTRVYDGGDVSFDYANTASLEPGIQAAIAPILENGCKPLSIGGDHSISYPIIKAIHAQQTNAAKNKIALVQFDAHCDTWEDLPLASGANRIDHGTGFFRAIKDGLIDPLHSIQIALRTSNPDNFGIEVIDSYEAMRLSALQIAKRIENRVAGMPAYLTFDIDALDPAFAPGTGTPVIAGLSTMHALAILQELKNISFVGADLVEVSPPYDVAEITALAGATILAFQGHLLLGN